MSTWLEFVSAITHPKFSDINEKQGRIRAVVVDDSPSYLEVVCAMLEVDDVVDVVARASNGADAIPAVANLRPDLLLMDVDMPLVDGLSAAAFVSVQFPSTKIVLMSAEDSPELRDACAACGAIAFIYKAHFRDEFIQALWETFPGHFHAGTASAHLEEI
jgi:two-component system, NarL family, nitrate/nitrite response regulator NarL